MPTILQPHLPERVSIQECFEWACSSIDPHEAKLLITHWGNVSSTQFVTESNRVIESDRLATVYDVIERRAAGEPIAYINGSQHFWNLKLYVNPSVLIPRPETELLVEQTLALVSSKARVLDLGTGSGAIALAIKGEHPGEVVACDIDEKALEVCRTNKHRLDLDIDIFQSNWYERVSGRFDAIVANPPYVAHADPHLLRGDLRFEPSTALEGGVEGTEQLQIVISQAPTYLNKQGWLLVEHGFDQRQKSIDCFKAAGFVNVHSRNDFADIPRIVWGQYDG